MPKTKKEKEHQKHRLHLYKKNDVVKTPKYFYDELDRIFGFDFDPCPVNPLFDGLQVEWGRMNYVNPPFSEIGKWLKKGIIEKKKGRNSLFLITFRPNNKYWLQHIFPNTKEIFLINKGIIFEGYQRELPIPLCLVYFNGEKNTNEETKINNSNNNKKSRRKKSRSNRSDSIGNVDDDSNASTHESSVLECECGEKSEQGVQTLPLLIRLQVQDIGGSYHTHLGSKESVGEL